MEQKELYLIKVTNYPKVRIKEFKKATEAKEVLKKVQNSYNGFTFQLVKVEKYFKITPIKK